MVVTICSFFYICLVVNYAQNQPSASKAIKFGEYVYTNDEDENKHLSDFAKALKRHPKARAFIIGYGDPFYRYGDVNASQRAHYAKLTLVYIVRSPIGWDNVLTIDGGYREKETVELYIVPPGASLPKSAPIVPINEVTFCPLITVVSPRYVWRTDNPLPFSAAVKYVNQNVTPTYNWTVSEGQIIRGQGTHQIEVKLPVGDYTSITATLEVGGFSPKCSAKESATSPAAVLVMPHKFDEYGDICSGDEKARLDNLAIELQNNPDFQVHVIYYGGRCYSSCGYDYPLHRSRRPRKGEAEKRAARIKPYLVNTRGLEPERVFVINGGHRESWTAELWIVPRGVKPPAPTPTIRPEDIEYRKGRPTKREFLLGCMRG